jgi:hypothetical protein
MTVMDRTDHWNARTQETSTALCAAGGAAHQVADRDGRPVSGRLCSHHFDSLATILRDVERETSALSAVPSMALNYATGGGGNSGGGKPAFQKSPALLEVMMLTDARTSTWGERLYGPYCQDCGHWSCVVRRGADEDRDAGSTKALNPLGILNDFADRVREDRPLASPERTYRVRTPFDVPGPVCDHDCGHDSCDVAWITLTVPARPSIRSERQVLTNQLDWISRQPWVAELWEVLHALRGALQRVNGTAPEPPWGRCPSPDENGVECGGPIYSVEPIHSIGGKSSPVDAFACSSCGRRWEGSGAVARLAVMVDMARRAKEGVA